MSREAIDVNRELHPYRVGKCVAKCDCAATLLREAAILIDVTLGEDFSEYKEDAESIERMEQNLTEIQAKLEDRKMLPYE